MKHFFDHLANPFVNEKGNLKTPLARLRILLLLQTRV